MTESEFEVACFSNYRGFSKDDVKINVSPAFSRHKCDEAEEVISHVWKQKVALNSKIFNASKFRFSHFEVLKGMGANKLQLFFGLTDYKSYLGLDMLSKQEVCGWMNKGIEDFKDRWAYFSRKVGVGGIVLSSDGFIILIQRSNAVGVHQGSFDIPGGHPEPNNIQLCHETLASLSSNIEELMQKERECRNELFDSILMEINEEINIPLTSLEVPILLGIVYQLQTRTPSFSFLVKCSNTRQEIEEFYKAGAKDCFETTGLLFHYGNEQVDTTILERLTPSAHGSLLMYRKWTEIINQ